MKEFYGRLGFSQILKDHPNFGDDPCMLSLNNDSRCKLALIENTKKEGGNTKKKLHHLALKVDQKNFANAYNTLKKSLQLRVENHQLQLSFYFDDIEQNEIEITCWLKKDGEFDRDVMGKELSELLDNFRYSN